MNRRRESLRLDLIALAGLPRRITFSNLRDARTQWACSSATVGWGIDRGHVALLGFPGFKRMAGQLLLCFHAWVGSIVAGISRARMAAFASNGSKAACPLPARTRRNFSRFRSFELIDCSKEHCIGSRHWFSNPHSPAEGLPLSRGNDVLHRGIQSRADPAN